MALVLAAGQVEVLAHMYGTVPDGQGVLIAQLMLQQIFAVLTPQQAAANNQSNSPIILPSLNQTDQNSSDGSV